MDKEYENDFHEDTDYSDEEIKSISECAEVLRVDPSMLTRLVWHMQMVSKSMLDEKTDMSKIDAVAINVRAGGHWHSSIEHPNKGCSMNNRFKT